MQISPEEPNSNPDPRLVNVAIANSAGYQYGLNDFSNGTTTIDQSDFRGGINYIVPQEDGDGQLAGR